MFPRPLGPIGPIYFYLIVLPIVLPIVLRWWDVFFLLTAQVFFYDTHVSSKKNLAGLRHRSAYIWRETVD